MTPQEKANATRQQYKEAQRRKRADFEAERELIRKSLHSVLESEEATPAERLESSKLLMELNAQPTPY